MKPIVTFYLFLLAGFMMASSFTCRSLKSLLHPNGPVTFRVFIDQKNYPGVEIKVAGRRVRTDNDGYGVLPVAQYIGKEQYIYIRYELLKVDTFFFVPLATQMPIYVGAGGVNVRSTITHYSVQQDTVEQMRIQLDKVGEVLDDLKKELNAYLELHPGSAMEDFRLLLANRENEFEALKERISNLQERYASVIQDLKTGSFSPDNQRELDELYLQVRSIVGEYIPKVNQVSVSMNENLQNRPDMEYSTDIFFGKGHYRIEQLTPAQAAELDRSRQKVEAIVSNLYPDRDPSELVVRVNLIGSTDGVRVGDELWIEIAPLCTSDAPRGDGNLCLSELRAQSLAEFLRQALEVYSPDIVPSGIGSQLAQGATLPDAKLRKCRASFAVYPREQLENKQEEYRQKQDRMNR